MKWVPPYCKSVVGEVLDIARVCGGSEATASRETARHLEGLLVSHAALPTPGSTQKL